MEIRKPVVRKNFILRFCIFAFVVYAAISLVDMQVSIAQRKQELIALQTEVESRRLLNKELTRQQDDGFDEAEIARIAQDKLDYVYPDQIVYIDISGS